MRTMRLAKAAKPVRLFKAEEIVRLVDKAPRQIKAATLLGINCAMGNHDIAEMPITAIDLEKAILCYPRPKTGIERRCPLWPETVGAIREVLAHRKEPKNTEDAGLLFITKYGQRYVRGLASDGIGQEFGKLLKALGIQRKGVRFYALRHTFRTVADGMGDQRAIDTVMGHKRETDISSTYMHGIEDARLQRVVDHVHVWLWPPK
jgi:integrase